MKKLRFWRPAIILGAICTFFLAASPVLAVWDWCAFDPQLEINGQTVDVKVFMLTDGSQDKLINGKMDFTVAVPGGTDARVISCEKKARVKFTDDPGLVSNDSGTPVVVSLQLKARDNYPMKMVVTLGDQVLAEFNGQTDDELISCSFVIGP